MPIENTALLPTPVIGQHVLELGGKILIALRSLLLGVILSSRRSSLGETPLRCQNRRRESLIVLDGQ